jgi:predicted RNA-binding Zn-ribbon protein involved in translation (DUF1610 family)
MAWTPVTTDASWHLIHGTPKVAYGAMKGETDDRNRLRFTCPNCDTELFTRLKGVSNNFVEWRHVAADSDIRPMPIAVFEVHCGYCDIADHFKIMCEQHEENWPGKALPPSQSRRARRSDEPSTAPIPVVIEDTLDRKSGISCRPLRVETSTDYVGFYCPQCSAFLRGGGARLVVAVADLESMPWKRNLISIEAFYFEVCCGSECGFFGDFTIPVTGQLLRSVEC